jgi:hypothetical protein
VCRSFCVAFLIGTCLTFGADDRIRSRIPRRQVESSAIAAIGYSKRLHALEIEFRNGAVYRYLDVSNATYRDLLAAPSKTRFYDENIRGHYRSVHVKTPARAP